jgi:hypothetical protein
MLDNFLSRALFEQMVGRLELLRCPMQRGDLEPSRCSWLNRCSLQPVRAEMVGGEMPIAMTFLRGRSGRLDR